MATTYFIAALRCPHCGVVSPCDSSTGMASKLLWEPGFHMLRAGDCPEIDAHDLGLSYLTLRAPEPQAPVRLLELWYCASSHDRNWAQVTLRAGCVERIEAVMPTRALIDQAHFLTENIDDIYEQLTGAPLYVDDELRPDFAERLKASLPE
jgi:hypothetical protein